MAETTEMTDSATAMVSRLDTVTASFETGLMTRIANVRNISADLDTFRAALLRHDLSLLSLALICIASAAAAYLLTRGAVLLIIRRFGHTKGWRGGLALLAAVLVSLAIMLVVTRVALAEETTRSVARIWVLASLMFSLAKAGLSYLLHAHDGEEINTAAIAFARRLSFAAMWAFYGIAAVTTLRIFEAGAGLRDLVGTLFGAIPVLLLLILAYWQHRHTVTALIAAPQPKSRFRHKLAAAWPWIAITVVLVTFLGAQGSLTIGNPLPPLPTFLTLFLVLIAPHLDTVAANWAERGLESPTVPVVSVALRRTFRFLIAIIILSLLAYLWVTPLLTALGFDTSFIAKVVIQLGLITVCSAFMWNAIGVFAGRVAQAEISADALHDQNAPRSRLGTLLPLIAGTSKAAILSMSILTMMIAVGINVWPIIGGLSVFGLAIAFGSQTLVKDIVSGLFFLTDDAFRLGEYIETSGAKGTVEKISIRSVSLRNARGALAMVPYGEIGKVTNFSRGWVIEKLVFRVAFDTDVELVRKVFKKIGQDITADPELNQDLLEPFKSQGISAVEDGTLVIRGKFMARAGKQFAVKKAVLTAVQHAFRENGIRAVPKPLSAPVSEAK